MITLTNESKQILRLMMKRKVIGGGELLNSFKLDSQQLVDSLKPMVDEGLVETNVIGFDKNTLSDAYFNVNFSSMDRAMMLAS
jgi:hypothetical protein